MKKMSNLRAFKACKLQKEELSALKGGIKCSRVSVVINHLRERGDDAQADVVEDMWHSGNLQCEEDDIVA